MADELLLSDKYKAFLRCTAPVEFLEGTTAAGKTTVGLFKFILRVAESPKRQHILSGLDQGTIEKNIINKELGILDDFGDLADYWPSGSGKDKLPHLRVHTPSGDKIVYVLGYGDKARWKKALGGQYGCLYIDEINVADMDYVREAAMRCDNLMATLNPDDPDLPVYSEYINHARPLPEWAAETPPELLAQLDQEPKPGWVHWFFDMSHNLGLTADKKRQIVDNVPVGTKLWKNKIEGLRGRATGLVFDLPTRNIITPDAAQAMTYARFSCGVDTAYSRQSDDTISFVFQGITADRKLVILDEFVRNNRDLGHPITPSDVPQLLVQFLAACRDRYGFARDVFIDSADAGTIAECEKFRRQHGSIYRFAPAWKKTPVISRIELQQGWLAHGEYLIVNTCKAHIRELNTYSWQDNKYAPEDGHDHTINASQYGWLPFKAEIGMQEGKK